jgi:cytochrome c-type biogenesis protein CcmE
MAENSTILRGAVRSNQSGKKLKFIIGGAVIVGLIVYLMVTAIQGAGSYYREVGEVLDQQAALTGKPIRVSGNIVPGSITYDAATLNLNFKISDPKDAAKVLPIHFHGVKPDQMEREGSSAIVEGVFGGAPLGTGSGKSGGSGNGNQPAIGGPVPPVEANNLLLKCPSRYEQYDEIKVNAVK